MNEIYNIETIKELSAYLSKQDKETARSWLINQFDKLCHYSNIKEWNQLVRVCEALRIIGWGDREPLEANATRWINGSYYTSLMNRYFEIKDEQSWTRLKDSYVLENSKDTTYYAIPKLHTQQNLLPKSPIRWQKSGNSQQSIRPLYESLDTISGTIFSREPIRKSRNQPFAIVGTSVTLLFFLFCYSGLNNSSTLTSEPFSNCSESHLLFLLFSARTTLTRFSNLRSISLWLSKYSYKAINHLGIYLIMPVIYCAELQKVRK